MVELVMYLVDWKVDWMEQSWVVDLESHLVSLLVNWLEMCLVDQSVLILVTPWELSLVTELESLMGGNLLYMLCHGISVLYYQLIARSLYFFLVLIPKLKPIITKRGKQSHCWLIH